MEGSFALNIETIHIAHKFVLNRVHKCEYPRGRGSFGLVYVIQGEAQYRFSTGEHITLSPGDVFFISPESAYTILSDEEFLHYTVNFTLRPDERCEAPLPAPYFLLKGENTAPFAIIFERLVEIWSSKELAYEMLSLACLYELLALFYRESAGTLESAYHRLLPARIYIEKHFKEEFSLDTLAQQCRMSLTNFRREWKRCYAEPPMRYRDALRLSLAKKYLRSGYYTVCEIADAIGFADASYFVRFFRKNVGVTPLAYRRHHIG